MDNRKQYYNNLNPGEKSIESRLGAKILMNNDLTINAAIRPEYLEQLRKEGYQGNVNPSFDDNTSIVYMGSKSVTLNQQGETNQLSLNIQQSENTITAADFTPLDENLPPVIITDFNPKQGTTGDKITIIGENLNTVRTVSINNVRCEIRSKSPTQLEIIVPVVSRGTTEQKYKIKLLGSEAIESKDDFTFIPQVVKEDINESNYDDVVVDEVPNYESIESPLESAVIFTTQAPKGNGGGPCPTLILDTTPSTATDSLAKDSSGNPTAYFNTLCAAKASVGTYTKYINGTQNGNLGCAAAISIIYFRAFGHGLNSNKLGTNMQLILGTYTLYSALKANTANFQTTEVFRNPGSWTPNIVQLFQPGDIILTRTECNGCKNGHVGYVSDEKSSNGSYKIINNSSGQGKIDNGDNTYNVQTWSKVAKRSGVGPTFLIRFIGTIGTTISIP